MFVPVLIVGTIRALHSECVTSHSFTLKQLSRHFHTWHEREQLLRFYIARASDSSATCSSYRVAIPLLYPEHSPVDAGERPCPLRLRGSSNLLSLQSIGVPSEEKDLEVEQTYFSLISGIHPKHFRYHR